MIPFVFAQLSMSFFFAIHRTQLHGPLTALDVRHNRFGGDGIVALCSALRENSVVETLYLSGNSIGRYRVARPDVAHQLVPAPARAEPLPDW